MKRSGFVVCSLSLVVVGAVLIRIQPPIVSRSMKIPEAAKLTVLESYGKLALSFEANQGQTDAQVKFLSRGQGYTLFLTSTEATIVQKNGGNRTLKPGHGSRPHTSVAHQGSRSEALVGADVVRMKFVGANPHARVSGLDELPGKTNYFTGGDRSKWRTEIPNYAKVRYENLYPGVDLIYYGTQRQLECDFVVAPGADPQAVRLVIQGTRETPEVDAQGDLVLKSAAGQVRLRKPSIYQEVHGKPRNVSGTFQLRDDHEISFELAAYDKSKPLIIDPVLVYSTYLGGSDEDTGDAIAVDSAGSAYVTGGTASPNFPTTSPGALSVATCGTAPDTFACPDVFVSKLNPSGTALVYSTYLSGNDFDEGYGIAVDSSGNAYVVGATYSTNFPTANAIQGSSNGNGDVFVAKINSTGSALVYSTYLGGTNTDEGYAIAVDSSGNAYITGVTGSAAFPTAGPLQASNRGNFNAFVAKLNSAGSALVYSTYLGGSVYEQGNGIAIDSSGNAYVTGYTMSPNFPTVNPIQNTYHGGICGTAPNTFSCPDVFVIKVNPAGSALLYSTYLGGGNDDEGFAIAVDSSGSAYVTGETASANFPTASPFQAANGGQFDAFIAKLAPSGSSLVYSSYLGGGGGEAGFGIALDSSGNAYVTGYTGSLLFAAVNAIQSTRAGSFDVFVAEFNTAGSSLVFSTYLGGPGPDNTGLAIAVSPSGSGIYVTGYTESTSFPTLNPIQSSWGGGTCGSSPNTFPCDDVFIAKIGPASPIQPTINSDGVVNGASFTLTSSSLSPGSIAAVFGSNLTDGTLCVPPNCGPTFDANGTVVPRMAGAQMTFNGIAAPILSTPGKTQLNVQIPVELTGRSSAIVAVTVNGLLSVSTTIPLTSFSPGLISASSTGSGQGAILNDKDANRGVQSFVAPSTFAPNAHPASAGDVIEIYSTGLGAMAPPVPTGTRPSGLPHTLVMPAVTIGGLPATVLFSGLASCCVGLNQVNVQVPAGLAPGDSVPVLLSIGGAVSNTVMIAVQ